MVRILVVGSGGQLGFELLRAEWPAGYEPTGAPRAELDVTDAVAVERAVLAIEPQLIVNAAAYTAVDRAEDEPERAFAVNRDGARNLARAGVPLIHVSTDYVFDGSRAGAHVESDAINPLGVYGASKAAGEAEVREHQARHVILRTAWVFGVHGQNFVKTMLRLGEERDRLRVVDDQRGCPTPASAIAAAIVKIAERIVEGDARFGTFHYAGAPVTTWHGFARAIFDQQRARGRRVPELEAIGSEQYPTRARRAKNSELDCSAIAGAYGLAQPSWQRGLEAVLGELGRRT